MKDPSPKRPALVKSASVNVTSAKPGAVISRQPPKKPRQTLERVLTDAKPARQRKMPSLSRSATEPILPHLKREVSDTSLSTISINRVALSKRYGQREVNLCAASQVNEAKLSKKASIDKELQGAIAALKKPNPRMAVKELIDAADKRASDSRSRKPKNPVRNPLAQAMQVMATPSKDRKRGSFAGLPQFPAPADTAPTPLDEVPPSSVSKVPCSTNKLAGRSALARSTTLPTFNKPTYHVEQTPTRGPDKFFSRYLSSSVAQGPTTTSLQPSIAIRVEEAASTIDYPQLPKYPSTLLVTPSKAKTYHENHAKGILGDASLGVQGTPLRPQSLPGYGKTLSQDTKSTPKIVKEDPLYEEDDDVELL